MAENNDVTDGNTVPHARSINLSTISLAIDLFGATSALAFGRLISIPCAGVDPSLMRRCYPDV